MNHGQSVNPEKPMSKVHAVQATLHPINNKQVTMDMSIMTCDITGNKIAELCAVEARTKSDQ